ncbi:MAG TPA: aromatic amino acid ammonia-lyase [Acidimicrobiales bacterium]|nr:aromatic amino acid ammonia-lyase [Acidimicrobiales bacterium]
MAAVTQLDSAPVVVVDGTRLALDDVAAVARGEALAALPAEPATRRRMDASVALRRRLVARGVPLYGITTGFGDSVRRHIGPAQAAALQDHLVRFMGTGTGAAASLATARATLLIRANTLARGHSGVRVDVVERLLDLLNAGVTPVIPEEGSVGASGDLVPLSYVAAVVTGRGTVHHRGGTRPAAEALAEAGMTPLVLEPKEALALMNGTAFMTAIATLAAVGAQRLAAASDICTALTTEVLTGITGVFHPFLHEVAKPHPGQARSAAAVRRLLAGSQLAVAYEDVVEQAGADDGYREVAVPIQDHYSVRCAPHFTGVLWDVLAWVGDWLETEINSSNDNPLFDATSGAVLSGGNFAGGHVALAMDALRPALASVADLVDRQLELVVDEKFNRGLTPNLVPALPPGHPEAGLNHGFKGMQISCSSLTAEALSRCMPLTAFSRSTECHNQDKVSMGTTAARCTRDVVTLVEKVVAIHLLALCQAADLRGPARLAPRTRLVHDRVRAQVPRLETDRPMADDIARVVDLLVSGRLLADLVV